MTGVEMNISAANTAQLQSKEYTKKAFGIVSQIRVIIIGVEEANSWNNALADFSARKVEELFIQA